MRALVFVLIAGCFDYEPVDRWTCKMEYACDGVSERDEVDLFPESADEVTEFIEMWTDDCTTDVNHQGCDVRVCQAVCGQWVAD